MNTLHVHENQSPLLMVTALFLTRQTCTAFTCVYVQALYAQREHSLVIRPAQYTTSDSVANGAHELVPESHHSIVTPAIVLPHIPISLTVIATETLNGRNNYAAIMFGIQILPSFLIEAFRKLFQQVWEAIT